MSYNHIIQEFEILDFPLKEADASLTLSFDEVVHIRRVISRAELLDLQLKDMTLFWEVWKNKVIPLSVCVYPSRSGSPQFATMHLMHPNYCQITILLVVASLAYFMMTQPLPIAGKFPIKTLVARQLPTNMYAIECESM